MMSKEEAERNLSFQDTKSIEGYDSKGNKKRGRPRGSTRNKLILKKPLFAFIPVNILNNSTLENAVKNNMIKQISISGYSVTVIFKDNSYMRL